MSDYRLVNVDLTAALSKQLIIDRNTAVRSVTVLGPSTLGNGATAALAFGQSGAEVPVQAGDQFRADPCEELNDGIFVTAAAQPGVTLQLYVAMSSLQLSRTI